MTEGRATYVGRIALVTGTRRGLGRLIAQHFLDHGARCVGFSRGEATIEHANYEHLMVDIGDAAAVQSAFQVFRKKYGVLHIVVNNAAVLTSQYSMIMPAAAAQSMISTNLFGTFLVSREAARLMRKAGWGRIINIGSMAASLEVPGDAVYAACKAGVATLANVMAKEFAPMNVTCNTLAVSAIDTEMLRQLPRDAIDRVVDGLPLPRLAEPDDVLNVIDFFSSERSSYITAQTIYLGGVN